ncbi:MAG: hypothetical protein IKP07_02520 [Bacilli bacterium]|nr:hypothetical protein [Bacilli bacterium]
MGSMGFDGLTENININSSIPDVGTKPSMSGLGGEIVDQGAISGSYNSQQPVKSMDVVDLDKIFEDNTGADTTLAEQTETLEVYNDQYRNGSVAYAGNLHSKTIASPECKASNGQLTYNNNKYTISDGTNAQQGTISNTDYLYLVGQVAGESANDPDDMLGVCSTILNRIEAGGGFGNTVQNALKIGYWPWGKTCDKYINYDANGVPVGLKSIDQLGAQEYEKLMTVQSVVSDAMNGLRNISPTTFYYGGDGQYNYFSDNV